jgi:transcription antitermination factor NusG
MSARPAFTIPVGELTLTIPAGKAFVPGLLWGNMAVAALLQDQGYDRLARDTLEKLQGWLDSQRAQELFFPGEVESRKGRKLIDGIEPGDGDLSWYAVRAATRQEAKAEANLIEAGFVTYAPLLIHWRRLRGRKVKTARHLLPGYIFVGCRSKAHDRQAHDDDLNALGELEYVHAVVRFTIDRAPLTVPFSGPCGIHALLQEDLGGAFDRTIRRPAKDRPQVKPGQSITVTDGPGRGFAHTFEGLDGEGRVKALFWLFGKATPFTYEPSQVAEFAEEAD